MHLLLLINSGLVQVSYNYWVGLYFYLNRKFYAKQNVCICFFFADILHALVFIIYCLNLYPEWSFQFFFHSSNSASWWYKVDSRCGFWLCLLYCPIGLRTEVPVEVKFQAVLNLDIFILFWLWNVDFVWRLWCVDAVMSYMYMIYILISMWYTMF